MNVRVSTLQLPRCTLDFETYSELDVRDVGAWRYAEHHSTEILCMSYELPGQEVKLWTPEFPFPQELIDHIAAGYPIEAHNAQFERAIWHHIVTGQMGIIQCKRWICSLSVCAYRAIPLKLEKVGEVLDLEVQKSKRGKNALQRLASPRKPTKKNPNTRTQDWDLYEDLYAYNIDDVRTESHLSKMIGDLPPSEYRLWVFDQTINTRGVHVDLAMVHGAAKIIEEVTDRLQRELAGLTDGKITSGTQTARIKDWLDENGCFVPNMQADTVEEVLKLDIRSDVRRVLEIRQQLSLASIKKVAKFVDCVCADGKMRGLLQYHGAGTGRWAGRLVQPQNFPRGNIDKYWIDALVKAITKGYWTDEDWLMFGEPLAAISAALRWMFVASPGKKLYVADFSAIEARVVMWVAGQRNALRAFHKFDAGEGPDIYCVFAESVVGHPVSKKDKEERGLGKIGVLGCGYQMGWPKLQQQAADANPPTVLSDELAEKIVKTFRSEYDDVPDLWSGLEDAAINAAQRKTRTRYRCIEFEFVEDAAGPWLTMILPSGRRLWYFRPEVEPVTITYRDKTTGESKTFTKDQLTYEGKDNKKGGAWQRISTYGGMLTENAVQAIARDLMVASMIRAEENGYPVILTVHDEVISERDDDGTGSVEEFEKLIAGPNPPWAAGLPVAAEAWSGYRYRK